MLKTFISLCAALAFAGVLSAQTHVSGIVSGVWGPEGNPYIAGSTLIVPQDSTLEILPGVEVYFRSPDSLKVNGQLTAIGMEEDSIKLHWSGCGTSSTVGIHLINSDTCRFAYCSIDTPGFAVLCGAGDYVEFGPELCLKKIFTGRIAPHNIFTDFPEEPALHQWV